MDPIAMTFYAVICGVLSFAAPHLGSPLKRLGIGAVVGIVAAALLPTLRLVLGM